MKVLVLGLNPSKKGGNCPTINKLKFWLDVLDLKYVSFCNIYHGYDQSWSLDDVEKDYLKEICPPYDKIITLGSKTHQILNHMGISHFDMPHPSGLNRQLNNPVFVTQKLADCKKYLCQ